MPASPATDPAARRRPSNLRSLDATLRRLRAAGRLDDGMGEAFATAARTCAIEVDTACTPTSDVPSYARGRVLGPYLRALEALDEHVRPVPDTDPWQQFLDDPEWRDYLTTTDPTTARRPMADPDAATAQVLDGWKSGDPFPLVEPD